MDTNNHSGSGQAQGWGTAVEAQDNASKSKVAAHSTYLLTHRAGRILTGAEYVDTTIILNAADTTFADTLGLTDADSTGLKSEDNKTFTVETININAHTFDF